MEQQDHMQQDPPSYAQSHDPHSLALPSVPTTEPLVLHHDRTLPPLPLAPAEPRYRTEEPRFWPSQNPLTAYYSGPAQLSPKGTSVSGVDSPTPMSIDTPDSRGRRGGSVVSIDDPDVRIAAEALGDLRADFVQSPRNQQRSLSSSQQQTSRGTEPEPLLQLLTTYSPFFESTINSSLSAYSASKNYSPRFKTGAEFVERSFTPVVNTVGSMGRRAGVDTTVRMLLGNRRPSHNPPSDLENGPENSHKRRRVGNEDAEKDPSNELAENRMELTHRERRASQISMAESLPAYDDHRSPSYEIAQNSLGPTRNQSLSPKENLATQLIKSTSGLSVAMSEESLRSLKYCLGLLRWASEHISNNLEALQAVLDQYEGKDDIENKSQKGPVPTEAEKTALHAKIADLKKEVIKTLKDVVDSVSKYAGGALPENAKDLVRRHLTSLPQRFRIASYKSAGTAQDKSSNQNEDKQIREGANRVKVLAQEGLDMMKQVSGVLHGTIVSAEEWCEKLGRKVRSDSGFSTNALGDLEKQGLELPPIRSPGILEGGLELQKSG